MNSIIIRISLFSMYIFLFSCSNKEENDSKALAYYEKGNIAFSQAQYYSAIQEYNKCIELNPNFEEVYNKLAATYILVKDYNQALSSYSKLIEINPKIAEPHFQLGNLYCEIANYNKALTFYRKALEIDSSKYNYHYSLGLLYQQNFSNYTEAIKCYEKTLLLNPTHSESYYYLGISYHKMSNVDEAIAAYKHAAQLGNQKAQNYLLSKDMRW